MSASAVFVREQCPGRGKCPVTGAAAAALGRKAMTAGANPTKAVRGEEIPSWCTAQQ